MSVRPEAVTTKRTTLWIDSDPAAAGWLAWYEGTGD